MSAVLRNSALYQNVFASKYLAKGTDVYGRLVALPFSVTIASAATVGDTYNLTVIPANAKVVWLQCTTNGLSASAGVNCTFAIGDSGSSTRYMIATDFDLSGAVGVLAIGGMNYTPTSETIVVGTIGTAAAIVGKVITGCLFVIPGA